MNKTRFIPAVLAVLAVGAIGAESAIGDTPYPVEIRVQAAKPGKVKGMVVGMRNPCANRVAVSIIGKGKLRARGRTNRLGIFRAKPKRSLKIGRRYRAVVRRTTDAGGATLCERAVTRFRVRRSGATYRGTNGLLTFGGLDFDSRSVQVYTLAPGGAPAKLTSTSDGVWHECPSWSPDGQLIYFDLYDPATESPALIYRIDATGGSPQLADQPDAPTHLCPAVDWTGRWVTAVQYGSDESNSIIRMRTDGSSRQSVARAGKLQNVYSPQFAPDSSRRILFSQVTYNKGGDGIKRSDLIVANGKGRERNITRRSSKLFGAPSWSPNGNSILAVRGAAENVIVRMNARGRNVRRLVKVRGAEVHLSDAAFSPDGSKIAYTRCKGDCGDPDAQGTGSIWVMNADGSDRQKVLTQAGAGVQPVGDLDWGVSAP